MGTKEELIGWGETGNKAGLTRMMRNRCTAETDTETQSKSAIALQ